MSLFLLLAPSALAVIPSPVGELRLEIAASADVSFIDEWTSTHSSHSVVIHRLRETTPDKPIHVAFIATGYTPGPDDGVHLTVDWKLITPSGSIMFDDVKYARYSYKNPKAGFVMLDPALDILLEKSDPLGEYTVVGVLHDHVTGTSAKSEIRFVLRNEPSRSR